MPLIRKRRIWWEPVEGASGYMVYAGKDQSMFDQNKFQWEATPGIMFKEVNDKNVLIIPDDWPDFPKEEGTYYIGITSRDNVGNQSDPFLSSGQFKFAPPPTPEKAGIDSF